MIPWWAGNPQAVSAGCLPFSSPALSHQIGPSRNKYMVGQKVLTQCQPAVYNAKSVRKTEGGRNATTLLLMGGKCLPMKGRSHQEQQTHSCDPEQV